MMGKIISFQCAFLLPCLLVLLPPCLLVTLPPCSHGSCGGSPGAERIGQQLYSAARLSHLCSRSPRWKAVTEAEKERLGLASEDATSFWMAWEDFVLQFTDISINHLINTSLFSFSKTWSESSARGSWSRPERAGGCLNHPATFLSNPQYRFDVAGRGEEEVVVQLTQREELGLTRAERGRLVVGLHLVRVEANRLYRLHQRLVDTFSATSDYIRSRHVFLRSRLPPGRYLLLPTTFEPGQQASFLLRLFSPRGRLEPLLLDQPPSACLLACLRPRATLVTRVTVKGASKLDKGVVGSVDAYAAVLCEGERWCSVPVKDSLHPDWEFAVLCYRRRPERPVVVQVWSSGVLSDRFLGQAVLEQQEAEVGDNPFGEEVAKGQRRLQLCGRKGEAGPEGTVDVLIGELDGLFT